jgi:hypothetical protein
VTYNAQEARQELLDTLAGAADEIGFALASLGEAYDKLDDHTADRLEEQLFRPVQAAYARARRTHTEFAARHGLPKRAFESRSTSVQDARSSIDAAVEALRRADDSLAALQDSMRPVEVGDAELRAGLAEVRTLVGALPARARELERTLGR